jgi:hypothetical protein
MLSFVDILSDTSLRLTLDSKLVSGTASISVRIETCHVLCSMLNRMHEGEINLSNVTLEERWSWFEMCMDWQDCSATTTNKNKSKSNVEKNENMETNTFNRTNKMLEENDDRALSNACRACMCALLRGAPFNSEERRDFVWSWIDALFACGQRKQVHKQFLYF